MTDLRELLRPRVERGAALLDSVEPYWWKRVEEQLSLESCDRCVLGQVFGAYRNYACREAIGPVVQVEEGPHWNGGNFGFAAVSDVPNTDEYWETLDELWLEAIEARRQS